MRDAENHQCELRSKQCVPCKGGVPPLGGEALSDLLVQLGNGWTVIEEHGGIVMGLTF